MKLMQKINDYSFFFNIFFQFFPVWCLAPPRNLEENKPNEQNNSSRVVQRGVNLQAAFQVQKQHDPGAIVENRREEEKHEPSK